MRQQPTSFLPQPVLQKQLARLFLVDGKLTGMAFRVPTINVSVVDLTRRLEKLLPMMKSGSYEEGQETSRRALWDIRKMQLYPPISSLTPEPAYSMPVPVSPLIPTL